jgi:hypothetical protein
MRRRRGGSRVSGKGSPEVLLARSDVREALCFALRPHRNGFCFHP